MQHSQREPYTLNPFLKTCFNNLKQQATNTSCRYNSHVSQPLILFDIHKTPMVHYHTPQPTLNIESRTYYALIPSCHAPPRKRHPLWARIGAATWHSNTRPNITLQNLRIKTQQKTSTYK